MGELITLSIIFFLLILVGVLIRIFQKTSTQWIHVFDTFALSVAFPALIFLNLSTIETTRALDFSLVGYNGLILLGILFLTYWITSFFHIRKDIRNCYLITLVWGNVAYIGLPYITTIIPGSGGNVSLIIASYLIILFVFGLSILEFGAKKKTQVLKRIVHLVKNPLIIATVLGMFFLIFKTEIPSSVTTVLKLLSQTATPLALIAIGIFLWRRIAWNKEFAHGIIIAVTKITIIPLLFFLIHSFFIEDEQFILLILEAGMPVGVTLFALTETYALNKKIIEYAIIISTLLSLITLPLLTKFIL